MDITAKVVIDADCIMDNISDNDQAYLLESIYESCEDSAKEYFVKEYIDDKVLLEVCKYRLKTDDGCFIENLKNCGLEMKIK